MPELNADELLDLKQRLVDGLAVLTKEEVMSHGGHLSVRVPGTETFLINPRFPGALARVEDVCTVDLTGKRIAGPGPIPSETQIHASVYRHRPDANSVLHSHPRYGVLVGLLETGLIPIHREARLFADGVPLFPESFGINTPETGDQMMESLGGHLACFLRGHGIVVAGPGIEGTCISAMRLESSCADQMLMMSFTNPKPLPGFDRPRSSRRLEDPYREWPFLLYKHGVRSEEEVRAALHPLEEGVRYV